MDDERLTRLRDYTTTELVEEILRREAEITEGKARLGLSIEGNSSTEASTAKNPNISKAKAAYWEPWHAYKAEHPNATIAEWRKAQKKGK